MSQPQIHKRSSVGPTPLERLQQANNVPALLKLYENGLIKLKKYHDLLILKEIRRKLFDELVEQPADELYLQHIEKLIEIQEPFPEYDQKFTESLRYKLANRPRQINIESILDQ